MANCPTCGTELVIGQQSCPSCGSPVSNAYGTTAPLPAFPTEALSFGGPVLAGFWIRFLGFFIDGLLLFLIVQLPLRVAHAGFATSLVIVAVTTFLYGSLLIAYNRGQTIGMRAVSVRCVDYD